MVNIQRGGMSFEGTVKEEKLNKKKLLLILQLTIRSIYRGYLWNQFQMLTHFITFPFFIFVLECMIIVKIVPEYHCITNKGETPKNNLE